MIDIQDLIGHAASIREMLRRAVVDSLDGIQEPTHLSYYRMPETAELRAAIEYISDAWNECGTLVDRLRQLESEMDELRAALESRDAE